MPTSFPGQDFKGTAWVQDLKQAFPELGKGLQQLLDYEGDVESTFCRSFDVEYDYFGELRTQELQPGGSGLPVTNANRLEFVQLYTKWLLHDSVQAQFAAFAHGFHEASPYVSTARRAAQGLAISISGISTCLSVLVARLTQKSLADVRLKCVATYHPSPQHSSVDAVPGAVEGMPWRTTSTLQWFLASAASAEMSQRCFQVCGGPALTLFQSEELELLVCGLPHLDFEALQAVARYEGGYNQAHSTIKAFWGVLHAFSLQEKKLFLKFTTGSDR